MVQPKRATPTLLKKSQYSIWKLPDIKYFNDATNKIVKKAPMNLAKVKCLKM